MNATCPDCTTAEERQHHGFRMGCRSCCARAMARGHHYQRCKKAGLLDREYRRALEQFHLTHEEVRAADAADAADFMNKEKVT